MYFYYIIHCALMLNKIHTYIQYAEKDKNKICLCLPFSVEMPQERQRDNISPLILVRSIISFGLKGLCLGFCPRWSMKQN